MANFRVNTYQEDWQRNPHVATLADGGFIIVYESYLSSPGGIDFYGTVVMAQRYDSFGAKVGTERVISAEDGASSNSAKVVALQDGGYAITWSYSDAGAIITNDDEIYVRAFNADDTPRTGTLRVDTVNSIGGGFLPDVFETQGGGFIVSYTADGALQGGDETYTQQFSSTGARIGVNKLLHPNEREFDQQIVESDRLTNGNTVSIWNSEASYPTAGNLDSNEIRATITRPDGSVVRSDFSLTFNYGTVGQGSGRGYDVTALASGGFVVTNLNYDWELGLDTPDTSYYTMMRFYNAQGQLTRSPVVVYASDDLPSRTKVEQLTDGNIVVVWAQDSERPSQFADTLYGQYFTSTGQVLGSRFDASPDVGRFSDQEDHSIDALSGGRFVLTYMSEAIDADHDGVAAEIFAGYTAAPVYGTFAGETLAGTSASETIYGYGGADWITPGAGSDTVDGGSGTDMVSFVNLAETAGRPNATYRLSVDLSDERAVGANGDVYTLRNIERVTATVYEDYLRGDAGDNEIRGLGAYDWIVATAGDDIYDGGTGQDMVSYLDWTTNASNTADVFGTGAPLTRYTVSGVLVDLRDASNNGNLAQGHTLKSIERITGSSHEDVFYGDHNQNDFRGLGGFDWFVGSGGGRERYYGGAGEDTVTYYLSTAGVTASLRGGSTINGAETGYGSRGDAARDLFVGIENLVGSTHGDRLTGSGDRNKINGLAGDDFIFGFGGIDYLKGGAGNDTINGGGSSDYAIYEGNQSQYTLTKTDWNKVRITGLEGTDELIDVEYFRFADGDVQIWDL